MSKRERKEEILNFKIGVPDMEVRSEDDGKMILEGYAAVFEQPTVMWTDWDGNEYTEVISRGAFDEARTDGCYLKYNHENSALPLARVRGGSMTLATDDYGLKFRAELFDTSYSRDVYAIVKEGGIDECSFAFSIDDDGEEYDRETRERRINKVSRLWDCAIVENPAYGGTSVSARNFFEAEAEREALENEKRVEEERKRNEQAKRIRILMEV